MQVVIHPCIVPLQSSPEPYSHYTSDPHTTEPTSRRVPRANDDEAEEEAPFALNPEDVMEELENDGEEEPEGDGEDLFGGQFEKYVCRQKGRKRVRCREEEDRDYGEPNIHFKKTLTHP